MKMLNICSKIKWPKSIFPMTHTHTPHLYAAQYAFRLWYYTRVWSIKATLSPTDMKQAKTIIWQNCRRINARPFYSTLRATRSAMAPTVGSILPRSSAARTLSPLLFNIDWAHLAGCRHSVATLREIWACTTLKWRYNGSRIILFTLVVMPSVWQSSVVVLVPPSPTCWCSPRVRRRRAIMMRSSARKVSVS